MCVDDVFFKRQPHHSNVIRPDFQKIHARDVGRRRRCLRQHRLRGNGSFYSGNLYGRVGAFPIFPSVCKGETACEQKVQQFARGMETGLLDGARLRTQAQPVGNQPVGETPQRRAVQLDGRKQHFRRRARDRP